MSLGLKLGLVAIASAGVVYAVAAFYNYRVSSEMLLHSAQTNAASVAQSALTHIESVMEDVESITRYIALALERDAVPPTVSNLIDQLRICVAANTNIFGAAIAYEPYAYDPAKQYADYYVFKGSGGVTNADLGDDAYRYHLMDWYLVPRELGKGCWSDPYYDEGGGNAVMCSFGQPFYSVVGGQRTVAGVVDVDVTLDWLNEIVSSISISKTGYAIIVGRNGKFIAHPNPKYVLCESMFSLADETGDENLRAIGRDMLNNGSQLRPVRIPHMDKPARIFYAPMKSLGWSFGVVIPDEELFADTIALTKAELIGDAIALACLFAAILVVTMRMMRPLKTLSEKSSEIAKGNLDVTLPRSVSHDEIGDLTRSFEQMRGSLKDYIENLKVTTAARERIEGELGVARKIQLSFVPRVFPAFPERGEFDIHAVLEPAREVGGDLYNFCVADEDRSCLHFCVGDVSDKGVPAALLMAVTQTLTKTVAQYGHTSPADILGAVNRELCRENDQVMFVTMLCATLNAYTGEVTISNAGHNPPLIIRAGGAVEWIKLPPGLVLAVEPTVTYSSVTVRLMPGDTVLLYTDGVTEAMDTKRELYSERRLEETARACAGMTPKETVDMVMKSVRAHAGGEAQSDDITVMALKFIGAKKSVREQTNNQGDA